MPQVIEKIVKVDEIERVFINNSESIIFTNKELKQNESKNKTKSLGARWLIKQSVLEFLKTENVYKEIEILNNSNGKPEIAVNGQVKEKMKANSLNNIQISISHSKNYIATLVTIE
ncbi:MAG: holo-ACP synthase [Bacteroidales bacterium]